ncbi:Cold regulated protein [Melia azedarach]|uniref:Cold regulated protein n=1 Tax=Melia azedarach TaxID=155640 RepID=A0ACC1XZE7_MELAZ|nr:Cold regulated protein [Melia azedarach]
MRGNSLRNMPSPDPEVMDGCRSELTLADSESSGITVESSHHNGNATPPAEWTNEKHNAYLDFLEASFVHQLHQLHGSMDLGGWCSHEKIRGPYSLQPLSTNNYSSSGQLMVLRDGNWQKIKFEENQPPSDNAAANSHGMLENPWIHHFTSAGKHPSSTPLDPQKHSLLCDEGFYFKEDMTFSCESAGSSEQHLDCHLGHQNSDGSSAEEVSDQNFVDEEQEDRSSSRPLAKRLRTAAIDASTADQVVPFGKPHTANPTVNQASSEREELAHDELFSEQPGSFARPRSDMNYFLRGS